MEKSLGTLYIAASTWATFLYCVAAEAATLLVSSFFGDMEICSSPLADILGCLPVSQSPLYNRLGQQPITALAWQVQVQNPMRETGGGKHC